MGGVIFSQISGIFNTFNSFYCSFWSIYDYLCFGMGVICEVFSETIGKGLTYVPCQGFIGWWLESGLEVQAEGGAVASGVVEAAAVMAVGKLATEGAYELALFVGLIYAW